MIIRAKDYNLTDTLTSGQIFRYTRVGDRFIVFHRDKAFSVSSDPKRLIINGVSRSFASDFFGLNVGYDNIISSISVDEPMKTAISAHKGLRILKQDPWECLVSFICSSCASIPKITLNLNELSRKFGSKIEIEGVKGFTFPTPGSLNSLRKIRNAKTGYRSKYLHAINKVGVDSLNTMRTLDYQEAKQQAMMFAGVGSKVADCYLLFAHHFFEAFPVDTWIQKGMQELYFSGEKKNLKVIREYASAYFGKHAGYAQQFLFHWIRITAQNQPAKHLANLQYGQSIYIAKRPSSLYITKR